MRLLIDVKCMDCNNEDLIFDNDILICKKCENKFTIKAASLKVKRIDNMGCNNEDNKHERIQRCHKRL